MNGKLIQRCFVNMINKLIEEDSQRDSPRFKTLKDFAETAFPGEPHAEKIWQAIKFGQKNDDPRKVSIEEGYGMAEAFGMKLDRMLIKAELLIEDGWTAEQDVFNSEDARKPGRRPKKKPTKDKPVLTTVPTLPPSQEQSSDNGG